MKTLQKFLILLVALPMIFISCKDDDDDVTPLSGFDTMTAYMADNGMDLPDILSSWIVPPPAEADLTTFLDNYFILDFRSATDFEAGHIEGAVNVTLSNLLEVVAQEPMAASKPILAVCYTGQSAGHGVVALRLSGYNDAKVLKWGMSGWTPNLSTPWIGNSGDNGNHGVGHSNWTNTATATRLNYGKPSWSTTSTDPALMLRERVRLMLQEGFQGVSSSDVLANPGQYFVNNYWAQADVDKYGHIDGAFRIHPISIATGELANLDPDETIVTYCWTGQTSSMITAYLTVLGYDARSLKFGANNMIYSQLEGHKFSAPIVNLPVVN